MASNRRQRFATAGPARQRLWLAPALALVGMLSAVTGWQTSMPLQNLFVAGGADNGENEFPGENEGGDTADGDLEVHLLFRRALRESFRPGIAGQKFQPMSGELDTASSFRALASGRSAASLGAARLPLRC